MAGRARTRGPPLHTPGEPREDTRQLLEDASLVTSLWWSSVEPERYRAGKVMQRLIYVHPTHAPAMNYANGIMSVCANLQLHLAVSTLILPWETILLLVHGWYIGQHIIARVDPTYVTILPLKLQMEFSM